MKDKNRAVSRRDVADLAEVSVSAVSLVLNNTPNIRISEATRKRITEAANKIGYRPSAVARALVTGKTDIIGVSIYYMDSPFDLYSSRILSGVWEVIRNYRYRLAFNILGMNDDVSSLYREKASDGMLLIAPPLKVKNIDIIMDSNFPTVTIGSHGAGNSPDYVDTDNILLGYEATRRLIEKGHKKILHISGYTEETSSARDRLKGYKKALVENNIKYDSAMVLNGQWRYDATRLVLAEALKKDKTFTAVFAASDSMARAVVDELQDSGQNVPLDCSVIGVNQDPHYCYDRLHLDTFRQPLEEIGKKAAELLIEKIEKKLPATSAKYLFAPKYISGDTVAEFQVG